MEGLPHLGQQFFEDLADCKRVLIIGPTDVGKSHFVKEFARFKFQSGELPWVVDLDVGQSDVGPVGTVGAVQVDREFALLEELTPHYLEFFGFLAPSFEVMSYVWAVSRLAFKLVDKNPLVIDTTGWVAGYEAFSLKMIKISLFKPDAVVLVGQHLKGWKRAIEKVVPKVLLVQPSKYVVAKDKRRRKINRYAATAKYFEKCPVVRLSLSDIGVWTRSMANLKYVLVGGFGRDFETVSVGWIVGAEEDSLLARISVIKKERPVIWKIGQQVTL
ncbi:hypothetical protein TST_1691 [Thermosulfidibacter takaii ABI70S6]|uniref:Clp1 P-loop domain-containing protein n=1 Tax=Thermosulfidibacter takaii (strain DSM 17441 / JCM 13301 / NBRC 103674 / ABI70S6) TaxID=1298851 RepID=A0A0S3QVY2_THET7|nr:Clp1/GlmU family protein [Thermosulfidibacter takaii]BAT72475.1 hypothetical protein TST_1691 [Thermosulfidibacter takaii ABI70S6]